MTKKTTLLILTTLLFVVLALMLFKVDVTQTFVVTQFGKPVRVIEEPGLKIKLPDPIQTVIKLDNRVQLYNAQELELLTADKKNVSIDYYGTWKISNPLTYIKTVKDKNGAESRLTDIFSAGLGGQLGKYSLEQLVNTDSEKLKLEELTAQAVNYAREKASGYGIEVLDTQIRILNFPEQNKKSVYDRMKAEREQMAKKYRAEGSEEASKIRAAAEKEQIIIVSEAYKKAQEIKGQGDAEAIKIYAQAFGRDPEFYKFIRTLETYEKTIDSKTTLVMPSTAEILKYLNGQ